MSVNPEGCFCEFASEQSGGLSVMCQYCVDLMKSDLAAANAERDEAKRRQKIDEEQCNWATSEAGRIATDLAAANAIIADLKAMVCTPDDCGKNIRIAELEQRIDLLNLLLAEGWELVRRYAKETPPGHQPHMITAIAEDWIKRANQ